MFSIQTFSSEYQKSAARLINSNLGHKFGFVAESMNPDLFDIQSSYKDGFFFLALEDHGVLGTGGLTNIRGNKAQIVRMHTHPDHRRRGVAQSLLKHLETTAGAHGIRTLFLETNLDWDDAIRFYEAHGYTEIDRSQHGIRFEKYLDGSVSS